MHRNSASTKHYGVSNEKEFYAQTFLDSIAVSIHRLASKAGNFSSISPKNIQKRSCKVAISAHRQCVGQSAENLRRIKKMSKFIKTEDGSFVLSSEIVRVRNHGHLVCTITTRSGESYSVGHYSTYVTLVAEFNDGSVIPAHPGYSVIRAFFSEEDGSGDTSYFLL